MAGLTKIVRHRLGQASGSTDHPDANLLAGFIEHSLTPRERSLVLGHLTQCAACREEVSVALPTSDAAMTPAAAAAARRWPVWLRWPVLRWGLLVASLAIMGTVALVRQPPRRMELASRANVPPRSAARLPSDVTVGAAPGTATKAEGQSGEEKPSFKEKSAAEPVLSLEPVQKTEKVFKPPPGPKVQVGEMALLSESKMRERLEANALRHSSNAMGVNQSPKAIVAQAAPMPPPPMAPAAPAEGQPASPALDSLANAPTKKDDSGASEGSVGKSVGGPVGGAVGGVVQTPPAGTPSRQTVSDFAATQQVARAIRAKSGSVPAASAAGSIGKLANPVMADWSISASGKVQRSRDGRKTWEELDVDRNVAFRAVFAVGPDVWLGGTKGALYHSTDGGRHWTRVSITTGSITVTDDVVHIEFKDAQHGTVKTAAGDTWTTLDGGQHWGKQS